VPADISPELHAKLLAAVETLAVMIREADVMRTTVTRKATIQIGGQSYPAQAIQNGHGTVTLVIRDVPVSGG
jgi:hypothetical protein